MPTHPKIMDRAENLVPFIDRIKLFNYFWGGVKMREIKTGKFSGCGKTDCFEYPILQVEVSSDESTIFTYFEEFSEYCVYCKHYKKFDFSWFGGLRSFCSQPNKLLDGVEKGLKENKIKFSKYIKPTMEEVK